jgi:hypothetical protein
MWTCWGTLWNVTLMLAARVDERLAGESRGSYLDWWSGRGMVRLGAGVGDRIEA